MTKDILQGSILEPELRAGMHFETFCAPLLWEVLLAPGDSLVSQENGMIQDWSHFHSVFCS